MNKMYFAIITFVILICGYLALNFWFQNNPQQYFTTGFLRSDPNELDIYPANPDMSQRDRNAIATNLYSFSVTEPVEVSRHPSCKRLGCGTSHSH